MVTLLGLEVQVFLAFVYLLPLGLILVFNSEIIPKYLNDNSQFMLEIGFILSLVLIQTYLVRNDFQADAINGYHIKVYNLLIYLAYFFMRQNYGIHRAICLTLMLVFMNSYYWEFPYHLMKVLNYGLDKNDIQQLLHLYPALYLKDNLRFHNISRTKKIILLGMVWNMGLLLVRQNFMTYFNPYNLIYNVVWRITSLLFLIGAFYATEKKRDRPSVN